MAEVGGKGFCEQRCEVDKFVAAVEILGTTINIEEVFEEMPEDKLRSLNESRDMYFRLLRNCCSIAEDSSCSGYSEKELEIDDERGIISGMHCPIATKAWGEEISAVRDELRKAE